MEDNNMKNYKFATEFTKYPGPRFIRLGKKSGEEFRETVLRPIFEENNIIDIDATGVLGFSPSFLDEAFSPLAEEFGIETFKKTIKFHSDDDNKLFDKMMAYVIRYLNRDK